MSSTFEDTTSGTRDIQYFSILGRIALLSVVCLAALALCWVFGTEFYESRFYAFFGSLAVIMLAVRYRPLSGFYCYLNSFARFLEKRGAFVSNPVDEAAKFALIRVGFGALMIYRAFWVLYFLIPADWSDYHVIVPALISLMGGVLVTAGLLTQFALITLIIFQWQVGDITLNTSTLGNDVAALFSLLLVFANAGAHFSIDGKLRRGKHWIGIAVAATYYKNGLAPSATIQIAKFLSLLGYGFVCLYSLGVHLGEPAWMEGYAGPQLLTNNFMSTYGDQFAKLFSYSSISVFLARFAMWGMLPWYLLLVVCVVWGGWPRAYALTWAFLFFCLSKFVLSLGMLAEIEFLFFAALFWQRALITGSKTLKVAYDDRCNLCDRTVNFIKMTDIFRRVELRPLSKNVHWLIEHGINPNDAQRDLYGFSSNENGQPVKGYDFYLLLTKKVALLTFLHPFIFVAGYLGGRRFYRFIADRRAKLFGVCHLPSPKKEYVLIEDGQSVATKISANDPITPTFIHLVFLGFCYVTTIPTPWIFISAPKPIQSILSALAPFGDAAHVYGITPINVFNHTDLGMAENWFTLSEIKPDGHIVRLPVLDEKGKKLSAHLSDRNYFGRTVVFRRKVIDTTSCEYDKHSGLINYLAESTSGHKGTYVYRQYHQALPDASKLDAGIYEVQPTSVICELNFALR